MKPNQTTVRLPQPKPRHHIGQVWEESEALARCAALAGFGVGEEDIRAGEVALTEGWILPEDAFEVLPA